MVPLHTCRRRVEPHEGVNRLSTIDISTLRQPPEIGPPDEGEAPKDISRRGSHGNRGPCRILFLKPRSPGAARLAVETSPASEPTVSEPAATKTAEPNPDLSTPQSACESLTDLASASEKWIGRPDSLSTATGLTVQQSTDLQCGYSVHPGPTELDLDSVAFSYIATTGSCSDLAGLVTGQGDKYQEWSGGVAAGLDTTLYETCTETGGAVTYAVVSVSSTAPAHLDVTRNGLADLVSRLTADESRLASIAEVLRGTGVETYPYMYGD